MCAFERCAASATCSKNGGMNNSLRKVLLRWLLVAFGIAFLLLMPIAYQLLRQPAIDAYDQALTDASLALIPHLHFNDGEVRFIFPPAAEQVLRTDRYDEIYFVILGPENRFMAGDAGLPAPDQEEIAASPDRLMYDSTFRGLKIRLSAIQRELGGKNYTVITAETTHKRDRLAFQFAMALILPMLALAAATGFTVWYGVRHSLAPIERIRLELQRMEHRHLRPLDEHHAPAEIRPLVHEFNALLQRLDAAAEAQQRFVANAAHQLRTPLAGVRTQFELARDETDADLRRKRIDQSIDAISRLSHLVHQLLALLSAAPEGREYQQGCRVAISDVIRDRSPEWVHLAAARNVDLGFEIEASAVHGDGMLLGELVANLVDNAVRYSATNGTVTVRCRTEGQQAVIEVEDNGPGIPEHERKHVFERFYRLSDSSASGSGLGLAIVQEIADGLGGSASITTPASGTGTLVRVVIPAAPPDNQA